MTLRLGEQRQTAISTLLDLDVEQRTFEIDLPFNCQTGHLIKPESPLEIALMARLKGTSISFKTTLQGLIEQSEQSFARCRCDMPAMVRYSQQRNSFRIDTHDLNLQARLYTQSGKSFRAQLIDISKGGMRASVNNRIATKLRQGLSLVCDLNFENVGEQERVRVTICTILPATEGEQVSVVGFKFVDMDARQQMQLAHRIASVERLLLRAQNHPEEVDAAHEINPSR